MKIVKFFSIVLFLTALSACVFTTTYTNRDEDKKDAEKVTNKLFDYLKNKNYDATYGLYSKDFWEVTSKIKMKDLYTFTQDKLGDLESTSLSEWETKVVSGTDPSAQYALLYKNKYKKYPAEVTIRLIKDPDGKIRILEYKINSNGFLAK
ncbi:MAG: hypothetical protein ACXVJG_05735 [Mucilaginibacter sp.]